MLDMFNTCSRAYSSYTFSPRGLISSQSPWLVVLEIFDCKFKHLSVVYHWTESDAHESFFLFFFFFFLILISMLTNLLPFLGDLSICDGATQHLTISQTKRNRVNSPEDLLDTEIRRGPNSTALSCVYYLNYFH